jgi:large subunit ribosomal protein L22|tara:strand:+ start:374 stop:895 length:522 start_codon:yes stop_codon:yes gene_type:complete
MKASLRSVRIAPKKAQLVAKMIRGQSVPDAVHILEHTNKKAARIFQDLLRSAMANASHNEKQDPQMLTIKLLTVNKAQAYHRGVPMARGRVRPMRKFLSHINLTLGVADEKSEGGRVKSEKKTEKEPSQEAKKPVKKVTTAKKSSTSTKGKSSKKDTTSSTSKSSASKKTPKK